jgi:hypothetical protein
VSLFAYNKAGIAPDKVKTARKTFLKATEIGEKDQSYA